MGLILELVSSNAEQSPAVTTKVFSEAGGTLGRAKHSDWVLPNNKVSSRHARITYERAAFYIEDTSTNGTYLNSVDNRLARGQLYPLHAGDRVIIEPYEFVVSMASDGDETRMRPAVAVPPGAADPFRLDDMFGSPPVAPASDALFGASPDRPDESVVDPLILLGGGPRTPPPRSAPPVAADLQGGSPFDAHFQPPLVAAPSPAPPPPPAPIDEAPAFIPENYNPLAPETRSVPLAPPVPPRVEDMPVPAAPALDLPLAPPIPPPPVPVGAGAPGLGVDRGAETTSAPVFVPEAAGAPLPVPDESRAVGRPAPGPDATPSTPVSADLAGVLAAAGLGNVPVTSELAQKFGDILRIVVLGVMDILRSRHQVKDEFRMRMTYFRPVDNNPLKFSVNADDALHNLLVKRNEAYLGPVEAFEDAFDDLRNHQLAMLAGMRVAFESTLAEFDPDRLQEEFDRQLKKNSVFAVGAKLRYWDLFRERRAEIVRDPEESFRRLFGDAFTKAYEAQLKRLKEEHGRG